MPTKQTAPSRSIRAAATVIISSAVYCASAIDCVMLPSAGRRSDASPELREVLRREHVALHPSGKALALARYLVPSLIKGIVATVVAERVGRKSAASHFTHRTHHPSGQYHRVRPGLKPLDDLFDRDDRAARREYHLFLHAHDAPQEHVASAIGLLRMNHGDVRADGGNRGEPLAGKRTLDEFHPWIVLRQIGTEVAAQNPEWKIGRARRVRRRHAGVAVFFDFEPLRPSTFDRVAQAMQRADARIASPREHQPARGSHPD